MWRSNGRRSMKLVSFTHVGRPSWGVLHDGGVVDVGAQYPHDMPTLQSCLARPDGLAIVRDWLSTGFGGGQGKAADYPERDIVFLPPVDGTAKFVCVSLNYSKYAAEAGAELPKKPVLFARWADSHVAHNAPIVLPRESEQFDYEGELAVVIGKEARRVKPADALWHVAGYSIYNDGSIRDWQRHTTQMGLGKNFWHTGSFGPCITTTDEIPDPATLHLTTRLNGRIVQDGSISDLVFDVPQLIEYISAGIPLHPGDVIVTGTPSGVGLGSKPPLWMKAGDTLEIEITKIGALVNKVVAD